MGITIEADSSFIPGDVSLQLSEGERVRCERRLCFLAEEEAGERCRFYRQESFCVLDPADRKLPGDREALLFLSEGLCVVSTKTVCSRNGLKCTLF